MEKREALEKCRDHWLYMAKTGTDDKIEYFDKLSMSDDEYPTSGCYCCEYDELVLEETSDPELFICDSCPLKGYAWNKTPGEACLRGESAYRLWTLLHSESGGTPEARRKYAQEIVDACDEALFDLDKKESECNG